MARRHLGQRLGLLDSVRTKLGITTVRPIDVPEEQLEQRRRERWNAKRRKQTRAEYEGNSLSRAKPWEAEGIHRRTWEQRRAKTAASAVVPQVRASNSLSKVARTCGNSGPSPASPPQPDERRAKVKYAPTAARSPARSGDIECFVESH